MSPDGPDDPCVPLRMVHLLTCYFLDKLTEAEEDELDEWISSSDLNIEMFEDLVDTAIRHPFYRAILTHEAMIWQIATTMSCYLPLG